MEKLEEIVRNEIAKNRNIGEAAGGSGHLSFVSITKLNISEPKEIRFKEKPALESIVEIETYTETEFEHGPEDDIYYTNKYRDRIVVDKDMNVLAYEKDV